MALSVRMLLRLGISVYSMRVVLDVLGIEDYGIYNVVAGFTVMFGFFNSTMSGAISRFLSYNIGLGQEEELKTTFAASATIQAGIALLVLLVAETLGLWFVNTRLVIPESRMFAANVIYQCSIFSMIVLIMQVPYNASIIAHEKMNVYAYIEVVNSVMLLLIVFMLKVVKSDRLIVYGLLMACVYAMTGLSYWYYCRRNYSECRFRLLGDWRKLRPILSFSGWDLYANVGLSVHSQGVNIILNMFWGAVLNAASGVANQIYSAVLMFSASITTAIRPQIIKAYANRETAHMYRLLNGGSRYLYLLVIMMSVPLVVRMDYILSLWLVDVPDYAVPFARIILVSQCIGASKSLFATAIHATGNISRFSILAGTLYLAAIPVAYLLAAKGCSPLLVYGLVILVVGAYTGVSLDCMHRNLPGFSVRALVLKVILPGIAAFVLSIGCSSLLGRYIDGGFLAFLAFCAASVAVSFGLGYLLILDTDTRRLLKKYTLHKLIRR